MMGARIESRQDRILNQIGARRMTNPTRTKSIWTDSHFLISLAALSIGLALLVALH